MEAKLRVILTDQIEKLVLPSGIPPTVEELKTVVKETFGILEDFSLQYLDSEFEDYFTPHTSDQIKNKDTIKIVHTVPVILNLLPLDESLGSSFDLQSTDNDSASYAESPAGTSSQDTSILSRRNATKRCQQWSKQFPIPGFSYETELYLERATEDYKKNGTLVTTSKIKTDLAETIYIYTAYPSSAQISDVAEELVKKYPCLTEPGSYSGYYGWQQSIKYKMANYRTKLRGYGVPEVMCNALKHKSPANQKSAKSIKKTRKAEVNYLPPYPAGEDEESQVQERIQLLTEIQDEFHRITTVHLEPKFMSKLDEYTPRLLKIFHSKGGTMGLRLQAILLKAPSNHSISVTRDVVIRCLMVYLGEATDQLLKEYDGADEDSVSQDLAVQQMKIFNIKTTTPEGPDDIGVIVEGVKVLTDLGDFARACCMVIGVAYAANLAYPKELRYTMEVFQKLFLELDSSNLSPKVNSLKNKLLA
ncbi:hypothetical protein DPEC_G00017500 [Dallia pectoralis]|uniref:Uncharacterized protein n=1 Tax=Dallia pectoralis TaxID=75939 RepID=A0ACC2HFI9_DALPE|nr:hypothetical protein DPEC_G00017500 [Dallia pectoralis]